MRNILLTIIGLIFITGCTQFHFPYRPAIQQGNLLNQALIEQLKPGMPVEQVRYLMGNPVLINVLDTRRWDYVYTYQTGHGELQRKQVVVHFEQGILKSYSQK